MKNIFKTMILCLFMNYTNGTNLAIIDSSINNKEKVKEFIENRFEKDGFTYSKSTIFNYENNSYKLTQIINKKNLNEINYLTVNIENDEILNFIIINKEKNEMYIKDFKTQEVLKFTNIDKHSKLSSINYDLIENVKNINESQGRFWGWSCGPAWHTPDGSCFRNCIYYAVFISIDSTFDVFSCGNLPGSNPKLN
jgi:hypothetical protein